jgi:hypothetical protein
LITASLCVGGIGSSSYTTGRYGGAEYCNKKGITLPTRKTVLNNDIRK